MAVIIGPNLVIPLQKHPIYKRLFQIRMLLGRTGPFNGEVSKAGDSFERAVLHNSGLY